MDTWARVSACLALCLDLELVRRGTRSAGYRQEVKEFLSQNFEMKDLGEADVILNIKLVR
jgi:hypothetical protein